MKFLIHQSCKAALIALTIVTMAGCIGSNKQESTGEYIDDTVITTKVKTELFNLEGFESFDISVETFKGNVQLSGFVDTEEQRVQAESAARRVQGINDIENSIVVKP